MSVLLSLLQALRSEGSARSGPSLSYVGVVPPYRALLCIRCIQCLTMMPHSYDAE